MTEKEFYADRLAQRRMLEQVMEDACFRVKYGLRDRWNRRNIHELIALLEQDDFLTEKTK